MSTLVIVESPAKAKTIEKYLGKGYTVKASYGHVRDLPKKNAIDIENGFKPTYVVSTDKKKVIGELKKLVKKSDRIILATDEDREGEAISWHLMETLKLDPENTDRIVFHEITKTAIQNALANPRKIDQQLVNAQQARRILDRIVGFRLSPLLWKKIKAGLSAGRVQSVAVRLIVEREREIIDFKPESSFRITAELLVDGKVSLKAELPRKLKSMEEAREFLESSKGAEYLIKKLETKPGRKSPAPPFTTSTLQQEASRKLSFAVGNTMRVAQSLYEAGHITYMRTDSVTLSDLALNQARKVITENYGEKYAKTRRYKTKKAGAQEAHEAIRPTDLSAETIKGLNRDQKRLYELIWQRTMASQMADMLLERTTADIEISTNQEILKAKGEVMTFDGFFKVYFEGTDDEDEENSSGNSKMLPPLKEGQKLELKNLTALESFSRHKPRYTEASLVKELENKGIGRPSTYAPTINTVQKRNYVVKDTREGKERTLRLLSLDPSDQIESTEKTEVTGAEKNKLFPTDLGMVTNDFLVKYFPDILEYDFTARMEEDFDKIAEGKEDWQRLLKVFYKDFDPMVIEAIEKATRESGERYLGDDPKSGKPIIARMAKFGAVVQRGKSDDDESNGKKGEVEYAGLRDNQFIETITLEEALELFKLPRVLGEYEGHPVRANNGRYGPYVHWVVPGERIFASLEEEDDLYEIGLDRAIELIKKKMEADANKEIKRFDQDVVVLKGRYGPYIKYGKENVRIPKGEDPESLTRERVDELFEEHKKRPKRGRGGRKGKKKS